MRCGQLDKRPDMIMKWKGLFALVLGCSCVLVFALYAYTELDQTPIWTQVRRALQQKAPAVYVPSVTRLSGVTVPRDLITLPIHPIALPTRRTNLSLAINMVILPFLKYGAPGNATVVREIDYKLCLKKNLAHPLVQYIHLLTLNATNTIATFKEFTGNSKLVISEVASINNAGDVFEYISKNLLGKDAMFATADIYLGEGFDIVDPAIMDEQKIIYAISRHSAPEQDTMCDGKKDYHSNDMCRRYISSHDSFLFRLHETLSEEFYYYMNFTFPTPGTEGRLIWTFVNVLKYCVLNPCSILQTFHFHCSQLRTNIYRPHLDLKKHFKNKPPSESLYCS